MAWLSLRSTTNSFNWIKKKKKGEKEEVKIEKRHKFLGNAKDNINSLAPEQWHLLRKNCYYHGFIGVKAKQYYEIKFIFTDLKVLLEIFFYFLDTKEMPLQL